MRALRFAGRAGLSFFSYNLGWWVCAFGVNYGYPWVGPLSLPIWMALHLRFSPTPRGDLLFFTVLAAFGFLFDTALIQFGLFTIPGENLTFWAPGWLVAMWLLLGFTFESLLPWRPNRLVFLLIGSVSGPLTYIWCDAIKILEYARPLWLAVAIHAVVWAAITPLLFRIRDFCLMALQPIAPEPAAKSAVPDRHTVEAPSIEH